MKKIILSLALATVGFAANAQVSCVGISPAPIAGNYNFEWAGPPTWGCPDFLIPGTYVQDTLIMVNDGTAGTHPTYGHPMAEQSCNPSPANAYAGKIAVLYRGDCEFGEKALNAENAGAVAVLMINHTGDAVGMGAGAQGLNVTIPVVMVGEADGAAIVAEMQNGPVVFFLGNKVGLYNNDVGADNREVLISPYGGSNTMLDNGFDIGLQLYNFGINSQTVTVTANIDGPSGNVYNETVVGPSMNTGDTLSIFNGNPYEFPPFDLGGIGNYPVGDYTLTYTLDIGADDADYDNVFVSNFTVSDNVISLSRIDGSENPLVDIYPSNSTTEYQSCMFFEEPNASILGVEGVTFVPYTDTSVAPLAGEEIILVVYQWNDPWIDLADPAYATAGNNDWFQNLNPIAFESYYPSSNNETGQPAYIPLTTPINLADNQRYLFCLQSFNPEVAFGYDNGITYDGNQGIEAMPYSPVNVDGTWYTGGWVGPSAVSLVLNVFDWGSLYIEEALTLEGKAYPNPAVDNVTISVNTEGEGVLTITDVSGKVAMVNNVNFNNGSTNVNIDTLEPGVYVFNVEMESGYTSQFNVVKK